MRIDIEVTMDYQLSGGEAVLLTLEAAQTDEQFIHLSELEIETAVLQRIDGEGMVGQRVWAFVTSERLKLHYRAKVDVTRSTSVLESLPAMPWHSLTSDVLTYLRPSRFCPSDLFTEFVEQQFSHLSGGAKVAAMVDWVATELTYVPGSSNSETTAIDTFATRQGVCRDYAHLVCALARAASIPARYTSVYAAEVSPPDFHAVAQVWLDGAWHLVDATRMSSAAGLVVIGAGRDAGDVAFMETDRRADPVYQSVRVTQE
ncbi:transglutaminase-like domain-containing protein [Roseibium sp.]|uniref:transglutaminase-like domain-containing protein n=1 Tax=Roseibium sp. TaxID=1936156 RepID=UPI003A9862C7